MLKIPGHRAAGTFLARHWQKRPLFMPSAVGKLRPAVSRHELAWLATLDDVESRLVFTDRTRTRTTYRAETGPFDTDTLAALPPRDWTLLVHDVEKHVPALRRLFELVPFVPDWRIDDLMISFAAPGGGVGPHVDQYDVFLCQGIGARTWHVSDMLPAADPTASRELALLEPFDDIEHATTEGDVLYLPPGVPHWGIARRASLTYSIGMRAPMRNDLLEALGRKPEVADSFYADPDMTPAEALPGWISPDAIERARRLLAEVASISADDAARALGCCATSLKAWLQPELPESAEIDAILARQRPGQGLRVHGMARVAFDEDRVYANGSATALPPGGRDAIAALCAARRAGRHFARAGLRDLLQWLLERGVFEVPRAGEPM